MPSVGARFQLGSGHGSSTAETAIRGHGSSRDRPLRRGGAHAGGQRLRRGIDGSGVRVPISVPSLTASDLHRCKSGPTPRGAQVWRDPRAARAPRSVARQDADRVRRPAAKGSGPALARVDRRGRGWTGIRELMDGPLLREAVRRPAGAARPGDGRHARHGRSKPLDCPDLQYGRAPDWIALPACAERLGPRFSSYRTSAAADDIDDVRRALGLGQITLYGDSYGTFLAQSYAFRHPQTLNALVLDSAYPVRGESPWYPEPDLDRCSLAEDRLPALAELLRQRPTSACASWSSGCDRGTAGWVHWSTRSRWPATASGLLPADRPRRDRAAPRRCDPVEGPDRAGEARLWPPAPLLARPRGRRQLQRLPVACGTRTPPSRSAAPSSSGRSAPTATRHARPLQAARGGAVLETLYQYCLPAPRPSRALRAAGRPGRPADDGAGARRLGRARQHHVPIRGAAGGRRVPELAPVHRARCGPRRRPLRRQLAAGGPDPPLPAKRLRPEG